MEAIYRSSRGCDMTWPLASNLTTCARIVDNSATSCFTSSLHRSPSLAEKKHKKTPPHLDAQ